MTQPSQASVDRFDHVNPDERDEKRRWKATEKVVQEAWNENKNQVSLRAWYHPDENRQSIVLLLKPSIPF
jgi:hypothetical protein